MTGGISYQETASSLGKEEFEPLGQKIRDHDPTEPPQSYNSYVNSAGEAEWQCQLPQQFYGSFQAMPTHCQTKILMSLDNNLSDLYGFSTKEQNVARLADSPLTNISAPLIDSPSNSVLTFALASGTNPPITFESQTSISLSN